MAKERLLEEDLKKTARKTGTSLAGLRASRSSSSSSSSSLSSGMDDGSGSDALYDIDEEEQKRRFQKSSREYFFGKKANKKLKTLANSTDGDFMQFSTPRNDPRDEIDRTGLASAPPEEFEERAGSSASHGGYVYRPVKTLMSFFNKKETPKSPEEEVRRKYSQKRPPRK